MLSALLATENLDISGVYGTSVGALNAAGLTYVGMEGLEQVWLDIKSKNDILRLNWWTLGPLFGCGIYNTKPLRQILDKAILGKDPKLMAKVCKINLEDGSIHYSKSGDEDFIESVEASASMPMAMFPINKVWVDGGVREITPLKQAIVDGADEVIVLLASPWGENPSPWKAPNKWSFLGGFKVGMRAIDIVSHEIFVNDIKLCQARNNDSKYKKVKIRVYAPKKLLIDTLEFDPVKIRNAMKHGYNSYLMGPVISE